ncbi:MAG: hypothetical protein Q7J15_03370 [Candidatus Desulfaltia sp.]|nr:hypothetical protein [Candidatus Desulfaltia sp.]
MKAMILNKICSIEKNMTPLEFKNLPDPVLEEKEILVKILVCGVCHTELAAEMQLIPEIQEYSLKEANKALADLKTKRIRGAKVLRIN